MLTEKELHEHLEWAEGLLEDHIKWTQGLMESYLKWVRAQAVASGADQPMEDETTPESKAEDAHGEAPAKERDAGSRGPEPSSEPEFTKEQVDQAKGWLHDHIQKSQERLEGHIKRSAERFGAINKE